MSSELALLIVGGGPCGLEAARGYRDAGGEGPGASVTDEQRMPYDRPPLTKELLRDEISEAELPLENETWLADHRVSLVSGRAVALDHHDHVVTLSGGRRLSYRSCLLATGAEPTRLGVPGADDPAVRVLRSLDQLRELRRRLDPEMMVIVIGSGFIGCEIAASLRRRGHPVTIISDESAPNVGRLGQEPADELLAWLREEQVTLALGAEVQQITRAGHTLQVDFGEGHAAAPLVVMATGVAPRSELLVASGTPLTDGAVPVDERMRTALPGVLAAGDVCIAHNATAGRPLRVEHWGDALKQGELAGRAAAGEAVAWGDVPGFWSTIGKRTLKYAADGCGAGYGRDDRVVGVLAHTADADYDHGRELIAAGAPWR